MIVDVFLWLRQTMHPVRNPFLVAATSRLQALQGPVLRWLRLRGLALMGELPPGFDQDILKILL